jgi:2-polyprenyl-6-methoxyphenol hydroxylase-like FAD-dependent oxidoreductase
VLPTMHDFETLAAERAPWFPMDSTNLTWTSRVTFTKYHVRPFALGRVLLVGDSAHQTGPVGIQSMNIGLREGDHLARLLGEEGAIAHPERAVIAYDEACAAEWRWMLDARSREASFSVDEAWLRRHEEEILSSLPASGKLLRDLMSELRVLPAGIK